MRRLQDARTLDDDYGADHAGYRDAVEEATVTIIRAEATETEASAIWPDRIANDTGALGNDQPAQSGKRRRTIGSRFLKALTGD